MYNLPCTRPKRIVYKRTHVLLVDTAINTLMRRGWICRGRCLVAGIGEESRLIGSPRRRRNGRIVAVRNGRSAGYAVYRRRSAKSVRAIVPFLLAIFGNISVVDAIILQKRDDRRNIVGAARYLVARRDLAFFLPLRHLVPSVVIDQQFVTSISRVVS